MLNSLFIVKSCFSLQFEKFLFRMNAEDWDLLGSSVRSVPRSCNQRPRAAGMSAPAGSSSISATNQLLMQTLLMLQEQRGHHHQQLLAGTGTTVGGPGPPTQQQFIPHPARSNLSASASSGMDCASHGAPHNPHGHYEYAQPALSMQQPEQHLAQQLYVSMCEPGQLPLQHQLPYPTQQQYAPHLRQPYAHEQFSQSQQQPPCVPHSQQPLIKYDTASVDDGAAGGSTQWVVSGSGGVRDQGASSVAWCTEVAHGFQAQEPPIKRARTTRPSEGDWVTVDGKDVSDQAAPKQWPSQNRLLEAAVYVPRIEAAWNGTVSTVSTSTLRRMRKRAHAMVRGPRMPQEPGARSGSIAAAVKRTKSPDEAGTQQSNLADGALAADDHASMLSPGACTWSETGATESTIPRQVSETGSDSVPERSSGGSNVSESNASGSCSGADSGNGHRSNASESNTASDSSGDSRSNASESHGSGSTLSESSSADSSGDSRSNASESNSAHSSGDSHGNASESNGSEGSSGHESSSNDGGRDGGSSGGAHESSSDRGSDAGSQHYNSSSESEARY